MSKPIGRPVDILPSPRSAPSTMVAGHGEDATPGLTSQTDVMLRNARQLAADPDSVILSVDQIEVRDQVREHFDDESLRELASDIAAHGQHQPIVVTHLKSSRFLLDAGERRLRAIRDILKRDEIRATIRRPQDNEADYTRELVQLAENEQRENLTKLEVARAIARLQAKTGWTDAEVAERMHRSRSWVTRVRGILDAPAAVQQAIDSGGISWHEWATDRDTILSTAESVAAGASSTELCAAYTAARSAGTTRQSGRQEGEDSAGGGRVRESSVSVALSTVQTILCIFQKLAAAHHLDVEVPKNPSRKQLADLLDRYGKKLDKVL